jgi:hypothetical protein
MIALYEIFEDGDESVTSPFKGFVGDKVVNGSNFWGCKRSFGLLRKALAATVGLAKDWNSYESDPPNDRARQQASAILATLEQECLLPHRLAPSSEGGITISLAAGLKRAEIETYNSGEIAAALYSPDEVARVWEFESETAGEAVAAIRVYLAS